MRQGFYWQLAGMQRTQEEEIEAVIASASAEDRGYAYRASVIVSSNIEPQTTTRNARGCAGSGWHWLSPYRCRLPWRCYV